MRDWTILKRDVCFLSLFHVCFYMLDNFSMWYFQWPMDNLSIVRPIVNYTSELCLLSGSRKIVIETKRFHEVSFADARKSHALTCIT